MVPCLIREDICTAEVDGVHRTYCSETCRWTDVEAFRPVYQGRETPNMGRLVGHREWETLYHGWTWDEVVEDMGYVRDDGKTMTAQPHLNLDPQKMWTTEHLKRLGPILSPNVLFNEMSDARAGGVHRRLPAAGPGRPTGTRRAPERGSGEGEGRRGPALPAAGVTAAAQTPHAVEPTSDAGGAIRWARSTTSGSNRSASRSRSTPTRRSSVPPPSRACAHARLQGGPVRVLQVLRPGRRGHRTGQLLHLRAARLREGRGL